MSKKICLSFVVSLICFFMLQSNLLAAKNSFSLPFSVTFKVGGTYSKVSADTDTLESAFKEDYSLNGNFDEKYSAGFLVGFAVDKEIAKNLSLETGLYYVMKKAKLSYDGSARYDYYDPYYGYIPIDANLSADMKMTFHYLEIPIGVRYYFPLQGNIKPSLYVGSYFALKLKATYDENATATVSVYGIPYTDSESDSGDIENMKSYDCGLSLGAGLDINKKYTVDVQYEYGLVNIDDSGVGDVKIRSFLFMIGYKFY